MTFFRTVTKAGFGVRARSILLVLLAMTPAVILALYSGVERRSDDAERLQDGQLLLAQVIAANQQTVVADSEKLLQSLNSIVRVTVDNRDPNAPAGNGEACNLFMANLLRANPGYEDLQVASINGIVYCSALRRNLGTDISDIQSLHRQQDLHGR
jgi:hypothetical protein